MRGTVTGTGTDGRSCIAHDDWLVAHAPEQGRPSLVHGDFGWHNLIVRDDARIAAVAKLR